MIALTDAAEVRMSQLCEYRQYENLEKVHVRIGIKDAGCSGFEYTFDYDSNVLENDWTYKLHHGSNILVSEAAQPYLEGSTLDWTKDGVNQHFKLNNPKEVSQCGCGVSVQFS